MQFPGCFQGFTVGAMRQAALSLARSALLRAGLRRKEGEFVYIFSRP